MESLQADLIIDIFCRVPTLNLLKLSSVCRRWRDILNDPQFRRIHSAHSKSNTNENQVLVLIRRSELYWVDLTDKTSPRQLAILSPDDPLFSSYEFIGSCNGLLCLRNYDFTWWISVLNPFTRQHLSIPVPPKKSDMDYKEDVLSWGFGFDEISKLYKVVVVVSYLEVKVCDLGSTDSINWRSIEVTISFKLSKSSSCFVNGRLHWIYWTYDTRGIISFDLVDEEFRPIPTPDCLRLENINVSRCLLVSGGCLSIFYNDLATQRLQIWVMKEYDIEASWVKELDTYPIIPRSLDSEILQVLRFGKDSELVMLGFNMETGGEAILFSSDSTCNEFKHLQLEVPPYWKGSIIHTASLNWI